MYVYLYIITQGFTNYNGFGRIQGGAFIVLSGEKEPNSSSKIKSTMKRFVIYLYLKTNVVMVS
jgi:hypothetical protein